MTDTTEIDRGIDLQVAELRNGMSKWVQETIDLAELAGNAERAGRPADLRTDDRSSKLITEIARWQERLSEWRTEQVGARLAAELRILKATLDATMDEANAAAAALHL